MGHQGQIQINNKKESIEIGIGVGMSCVGLGLMAFICKKFKCKKGAQTNVA